MKSSRRTNGNSRFFTGSPRRKQRSMT